MIKKEDLFSKNARISMTIIYIIALIGFIIIILSKIDSLLKTILLILLPCFLVLIKVYFVESCYKLAKEKNKSKAIAITTGILFDAIGYWIYYSLIEKEIKTNYYSTKEFFNRKEIFILLIIVVLIGLIFISTWIRTLNVPQLKDSTTNNWTLAPDLDPFLYLRNANEIVNETAGPIDTMRNVPVGAESYIKTSLMPKAIVYMYKISTLFGNSSLTYAAIIIPVILFAISIIGFFLFCLFLFRTMKFSRLKCFVGSTIASFLYVISPELLHRTTGGVPEIESLGMAFYWFAFLFFVLAWNEKNGKIKTIIFSVIAGLFTGLMSWSWGGYKYIYMIITLASLVIFLFKKENKLKNITIFSSWFIPAIIIEFLKTRSISSIAFRLSDTGFALFLFFTFIIYFLIYHTKIKDALKLEKIKLPKSLTALIISAIITILLIIILKPNFIVSLLPTIIQGLLYPFGRGRVAATVAENASLHLDDIINTFGYLFWSFLIGTIFLFYEMTKEFKTKKRILFNIFFIIFVAGVIFSRISDNSILNGETFISKLFYIGGILVFIIFIIAEYIKTERKNDEDSVKGFNSIPSIHIFLLAFTFWVIVSMKGAVRMEYLISPILVLMSCYLLIKIWDLIGSSKEEVRKIILIIVLIAILFIFINSSLHNTKSIVAESRGTVPGIYEQQWQKAMAWIRAGTVSGSVFVHWWDYGYWVQTIGERPTITDGGHFIGYWDHLVGRYLLTEINPSAAMGFMKSHNVSYLLIDSTDLGKYAAYSRIGGDSNYDRSSYMGTMVSDKSNIKETQNSTIRIYQGGVGVDQDIIYGVNGSQVFLPGPTYNDIGDPSYKSFLGAVIIEIAKDKNNNTYSKQPQGIFVYNNQQNAIPLRYLYYNGKLIDFKSGLEAVAYLLPRVYSTAQGQIAFDDSGSAIYLSPKVSQSLFAQLYLMNDPQNKYPNVKLAHSEDDVIINSLKSQGFPSNGFLDYNGFRGPIKIWKVENNESIITHDEFLRTTGNYAEFDNLTFVK